MQSGRKSTDASKDRYRVLLVDDETNIVYDLKRGLEVRGFKVDDYDSPQDGINSFKPNLYDLAILDIRMPGLNGFSIHSKMKQIDSPLTACFLSASEIDPEEFKKVFPSRSEGVKAIIRKPFAANDLLREIDPL
ncbi:MAG: response regulator [Nitrososphaera sp.]